VKAERYVVLTCLDFPPTLQRREKIGFSSQRIRKSFASGFEFVFPSPIPLFQPLPLPWHILCIVSSQILSDEREKCFYWARRKEGKNPYSVTMGDSTSGKVDVLYNFMTEKNVRLTSYGAACNVSKLHQS
jgi:hypothetical protein